MGSGISINRYEPEVPRPIPSLQPRNAMNISRIDRFPTTRYANLPFYLLRKRMGSDRLLNIQCSRKEKNKKLVLLGVQLQLSVANVKRSKYRFRGISLAPCSRAPWLETFWSSWNFSNDYAWNSNNEIVEADTVFIIREIVWCFWIREKRIIIKSNELKFVLSSRR